MLAIAAWLHSLLPERGGQEAGGATGGLMTGASSAIRSSASTRLASTRPHRPVRIVLGLSGSVAAIKAPLLVPLIKQRVAAAFQPADSATSTSVEADIKVEPSHEDSNNLEVVPPSAPIQVEVHVVATEHAAHFFNAESLRSETANQTGVLTDVHEWVRISEQLGSDIMCITLNESLVSKRSSAFLVYLRVGYKKWSKIGDPVLHIALRGWADLLVIAPLDANTLAKLSHGMCDNLLTCIARAWDYTTRPLIVCPAMNTFMWDHPATARQLDMLQSLGMEIVPPIAKRLACGDLGTRLQLLNKNTNVSNHCMAS
ncbi:phosphopantothenoylcysteine decarboxylase, variant 1 [Capsaspora owczarzaki ATCC 30864]|uniref:Phosphopantothenoylcysteine decarboxylase, variant 1 n=1 Tax=Capsaspora owczarzaki (strain ATCC 30864) TaxID=595528 RepID=A0A0D2WI64_CAPO3|nr:phosphopantothenoylcysteine decarboxylase, variant 1 [Capsaspora owczarzaki ATCC 30864]